MRIIGTLVPFCVIGNSKEFPITQKKEPSFDDSSEATTRFELVIRVLQTHALPLGYVAINDPNEIRTRVTAVKGRCLNRLTMGPDIKLKTPRVGLEPTTARLTAACSTN